MEAPNIWEQLFYIAIIVVSMVFGGHLYRKRHDAPSAKKAGQPAKKAGQPAKKKRPKKKR